MASLAGVLISVIGFGATLINLAKTSSAAKRAELAATKTQKSIRLFDTVADASKAVSMLEEAKRLNRAKEWKVLLDRLSDIKKILVAINIENSLLNDLQTRKIQSSVTQLATMEHVLEKAISESVDPDDPLQIARTISKQIEKVYAVLIELKQERTH
ncbi:hypothetical protein [Thalassospira xiamenensis]|uniref:hypothetical protein n=1 Tax=Thalassospira xiamenensis TaxID=220697 RepID=UPI001FFE4B21|nr:hypothetical protein [Thalassospira xiamenensis]MCK2165158.1 hypothetical protein [Thalassospira xiamenensis]